MHPQLQKVQDALERSTAGLNEEQMTRHPEGKWDVAHILEHLALTYTSTARVMEKCLDEGRPLATKAKMKTIAARVVVSRMGIIPGGRKSPERVAPKGMPGVQARSMALEGIRKMDEALKHCEERFGSKVKVADHPVLGPIPVPEWRKFHLLHTLHHMKQVDALVQGSSKAASATR